MALEINYPAAPAGKRTIRTNIYGNTSGYVSGRRFWEFGCDARSAGYWVAGASLEHAYCDCWIEDDKHPVRIIGG